MTITDPAVWGPILISISVLISFRSAEFLFRVNANRVLSHLEEISMRLDEIEKSSRESAHELMDIRNNTTAGKDWD